MSDLHALKRFAENGTLCVCQDVKNCSEQWCWNVETCLFKPCV